jgi:hypothetical protein
VQQADRAVPLALIARQAQYLETVREALPDKPQVHSHASSVPASEKFSAVRSTVAFEVINAQVAGRAAAGAHAPVMIEDSIAQLLPPALLVLRVSSDIPTLSFPFSLAVPLGVSLPGLPLILAFARLAAGTQTATLRREPGPRLPLTAFAAALASIVVHVTPPCSVWPRPRLVRASAGVSHIENI